MERRSQNFPVDVVALRGKVIAMNANWAAENLQTIRTLMERSALYRRQLAPITLLTGVVGLAAGGVGWMTQCDSPQRFILFWFAVACVALVGAFVVVRRQALRDKESFWSPPTRRVAQAMMPSLFIGLIAGLVLAFVGGNREATWELMGLWMALTWTLIPLWMALYGAALHAAGFFMPRGIKVLGWLFIIGGTVVLLSLAAIPDLPNFHFTHPLMGGIFGGLHLAYGIYLHFTEKKIAP